MNKDEAVEFIKHNITDATLLKHMIAVGAIMEGIAKYLNIDSEKWAIAGLLHDIDFEKTSKTPEKHGLVAENILDGKVDSDIIKAIKSHNFEYTGITPNTEMELALIAADAISGLIIAAALIHPSKKLKEVSVESIAKKFKKKDFARNCNRENILYCEKIGIERNKFFEIALIALQNISGELDL